MSTELNVQEEMADMIGKLKIIFNDNMEKDPRLSVLTSKELRGYLTEYNNIIRGRSDRDDIEAVEVLRVVQAVKKFASASRTGLGKGGRRGPPPLGSGAVCRSRDEVPEGSEKTEESFEAYIESGSASGLRSIRDSDEPDF